MPTVFPATVYNKGGTDKEVILSPRTQMIYPFQAPEWTDLRVGFFLSLTKPSPDDDDTTGLAETITNSGNLLASDRYWIGVKNRNALLPKSTATTFIGYTNASLEDRLPETIGDTVLSSSDVGVGTSNAYYWRPNNSHNEARLAGGIWDGIVNRFAAGVNQQQHFVQDASGIGGDYSTLLMLRLRRAGNTITVTSKVATNSADVLFTDTPTLALLLSNLEAFPATVQQWGPITLSVVPDALYAYWPFFDSRLRISALGILKAG